MFIRQCYDNVMIVIKALHKRKGKSMCGREEREVHNTSLVFHGSHSGFVYFMPTALSALSLYNSSPHCIVKPQNKIPNIPQLVHISETAHVLRKQCYFLSSFIVSPLWRLITCFRGLTVSIPNQILLCPIKYLHLLMYHHHCHDLIS